MPLILRLRSNKRNLPLVLYLRSNKRDFYSPQNDKHDFLAFLDKFLALSWHKKIDHVITVLAKFKRELNRKLPF